MISLFQAIIAFVLLALGTFYYFKTRSPPETPKSGDFDPFEEVEAEQDIKPAKPTPAVADEPVTDLEPEVIVTPSKPEPENEDEPVKPTPFTTPAKPLVPEKPKPTPKPVVTVTPSKPEPENEDEPVKPTPVTTPAKPLVPEKPKSTPKPVVTNRKRVLTNEEVIVFLGKIQNSINQPGTNKQCQADAFKKAWRVIMKDNQFDEETRVKMLDPKRSSYSPMESPGSSLNNAYLPVDVIPEYVKLFPTHIRPALEKCARPIRKVLVSPKPVKPEPEFRMGWPVGTKWNIKGATLGTQKCNDNCKSLGYNYFTHNPPPQDGGYGCFKSSLKLSELNITDHVNAKTRRVV